MLAAKRKRSIYSVLAITYASMRDRNWQQQMFVPTFRSELVYLGRSERLAAWHFTRSCQAQMQNRLAYGVVLKRDGVVLAGVRPLLL